MWHIVNVTWNPVNCQTSGRMKRFLNIFFIKLIKQGYGFRMGNICLLQQTEKKVAKALKKEFSDEETELP